MPNHLLQLSAGLLLMAAQLTQCSEKRQETDPPNVIVIMGDDMRWHDFGFIRGRALTPNLDRLAGEGFYFSRTYVPSAACTPTRFCTLTGRQASRCQDPGFRSSATPEGMYPVVWNTNLGHEPDILPRVMKEAGYVTGMAGKWHNGTSDEFNRIRRSIPRDGDPADPEIRENLDEMNRAMQEHLYQLGFDYAEAIVYQNYPDHPLKALHYHNQEVITRAAVDFIRSNREKPFFFYMPTTLMHGPSPWKSLHADPGKHYGGLLDEPLDIQPSREEVIARGREAGIDEGIIPATWLDDGIGKVLSTLEELGLEENTIVIFMNDQGHDGGKGSCYEGGIRVPSIVHWPGTIEPGTSDALVSNMDLYPTILEACGIAYSRDNHDGESLWPILKREKEQVRDHLYCEWSHTRAIVTEDWKYLAFRLPPSQIPSEAERKRITRGHAESVAKRGFSYEPMPHGPLSHTAVPGGSPIERYQGIAHYPHYFDSDQLYHLEADSLEQVNLAGDPEYSGKLKELQSLLSRWVEELPGSFAEF